MLKFNIYGDTDGDDDNDGKLITEYDAGGFNRYI